MSEPHIVTPEEALRAWLQDPENLAQKLADAGPTIEEARGWIDVVTRAAVVGVLRQVAYMDKTGDIGRWADAIENGANYA